MKPPDDKKDFFTGWFAGGSLPSPLGQTIGKHPDFFFALVW
jgi:hypothetical protein